MRLREFVDRKKQKLSEVVVAAAPAAIPAWMWIAGALGIGVGVYSQQQIQNWINNPNEYAAWKKENPGEIKAVEREVQKQLDAIEDQKKKAEVIQQAEKNRIVAMAQNPDESVTSKIQGYESGQLVIQGTNSFQAQRDANRILATQPEGSVVWILNSDGTYGRYKKTEPKGGTPAWTSSSVAAPGVADTTPPGTKGRDPDAEGGLTWKGKAGAAGTGAAGATTVGPDTDEVDDIDVGPVAGAQPDAGSGVKPETGTDTSGQSAGTVDKPEAGAETEVGSGEITDIGPDVQSPAQTQSGDIGADVGSAADGIAGVKPETGAVTKPEAIPQAVAKPEAIPQAVAKPDAAAIATTMPPPVPPPPFPGKFPSVKPSGAFTYSGARKRKNDPIKTYAAIDDRGTQKPWGQ